MTWFQERFFVVIEEEWINPTYIFHRRLVDFAATVIRYVKEQENDFHLGPIPRHTLTEVNITKHFLNHFCEGYADLAETFLEMRQTASPRLYYDGPTIRIEAKPHDWKRRFLCLGITEKNEASFAPLTVHALKLHLDKSAEGDREEEQEQEDVDMDVDDEDDEDDEDSGEDEDDDEDGSSLLSSVPTSTPPPAKRNRPSPASTPSKTPSSSRPAKRQR
jgi:hypothetical protein